MNTTIEMEDEESGRKSLEDEPNIETPHVIPTQPMMSPVLASIAPIDKCDDTPACAIPDNPNDLIFVTKLTEYMRHQLERVLCIVPDSTRVTLLDIESATDFRLIFNLEKDEFTKKLQNLRDRDDNGLYEPNIYVEYLHYMTDESYYEASELFQSIGTNTSISIADNFGDSYDAPTDFNGTSISNSDSSSDYIIDYSSESTEIPVDDDEPEISFERYQQFRNGQNKKAFIILHGDGDINSTAKLANLPLDQLEKSWMSFDVIKDSDLDEPDLQNALIQYASNYTIIPSGDISYADYVGYSICHKEVARVDQNLNWDIKCNDFNDVKVVVDGGVRIEDRFLLESAAIQFAYAYRDMQMSLYYAGQQSLRGKYDLVGEPKFLNLVHHIEKVARQKINNPDQFDDIDDLSNCVEELVSERARSGKPSKIALFTTFERIEIIRDTLLFRRSRTPETKPNHKDVFTFIHTLPDQCTCKSSFEGMVPGQIEWIQNDTLTKTISDVVERNCRSNCKSTESIQEPVCPMHSPLNLNFYIDTSIKNRQYNLDHYAHLITGKNKIIKINIFDFRFYSIMTFLRKRGISV